VQDDPGTPGASAQREYERRKAKAKSLVSTTLDAVLTATTDEPQSTQAWARGAYGERKLAEVLAGVPNGKLLHDRRIPGTQANFDHLVVAPAGVFVVDSKLRKGLIDIRSKRGFPSQDLRLFIGSRDRSSMVEKMAWQVRVVRRALETADFKPIPLLVPVICFVDGSWPVLYPPPQQYLGVWLEDGRSIVRFVGGAPLLDAGSIAQIHHVLALAFPAK
jgi:hypothetical protein